MWNQQQPGPVPPSTTDPSQAPGQSRGLLALVREYLGGWLGPRLAPESRAGVEIASEKVHSGPAQVILPWFLPYFDDYTAEPAAARAAYRRMFADPNVKSALLGKLLAVAALDLKVRPADKKDPQDLKIAEFVKWTLVERVRDGFPGLIWSVLSGGLIDGYSVCEKVFEQEEGGEWDGQWPLVAVKPKDVGNDLVLQTDSYRNVVGVMGLRYNAGQEFSPARFLLWRHLPLYDTPTGMSDLRAVYSRYWLLDTVLKLRGVNAEKRAIPFLMGTYTNPTQQRSLENTLAQVKSQAWVTVPEGVRVEALNIAGSADSVFEGFIRDLKHDIFMGIQGAILQALEGSVSDGRGNSQVHRSTADLLVWYIAQTMQSLLNDRTCGLIKDIVDLNFVVQRYPRASLSAVDVGEMTAELDIDTKLFGMGIELSKEDMYERYNRVPPLNEADALKKDAGGPGGMPGMPGSPPGGGGLPSGGDDPAGGDDDGIDPPEGGDYDPAEDDDGLFDEPNLFTAPMRQFGEWEEDKHPRGEDGKFGGGSSGKAKAGSSEVKKQFKAARREARAERPADAKAARQQVKERRAKVEAAKKAIVEHAENSFDLEQELGQLAFRGPAVNRVLDRLSLTYPDEKTVRGREVPKGSVDRLDDFRALAQAASNAQASYKQPKSGDEAEDYQKVQALMGKVKDYADQGVAMYRDAVKVKRGGKDRPASIAPQPAEKAPASKPAEPAPWERNLAALASKYDVDYGDLDNLASSLPGEIAASKGHAKKALEKKLGAVKGIIRDRDAMRRQGGESFAESDWTQQKGERGGTKWVNRNTGREVYGKSNPGSGSQQKKKSRRIEAARVSQPGGGSIDHTSGPAPRQSVLGAAGGRVAGLIRQAKHSVDHVEHAVSDYLSHGVDRQIERLPGGIRRGVAATWWAAKLGTRAAFITYTTGQKLAEEVAKESGATPEQTARLKGVCTALDLVGAKAVPLVLGSLGLGAAALPGSFVPAGSAAYLAYSTARRPLAVLRAARNVIKGMSDTLSSKFSEVDEDTLKLVLIYLAAELSRGKITQEEYDQAVEMLTDSPEEFAEEDWEEGRSRTGGVKWTNRDTKTVKYQKENPGKSKRKAKEEGSKPVKEKPAPKSRDGGLNLARLVHTVAGKSDVGELADILGGLHNDDLQGLKKEWKLKVGGTKAVQAKALAKHVLDAVRGLSEEEPTPAKPKKERKQPAEKVEKVKPDGSEEKGKPISKGPASVVETRSTIRDAYNDLTLLKEFRDGLVEMPVLFRYVQRADPSITLDEFHAQLNALNQERKMEFHKLNEVVDAQDPELAISRDDKLYYYVKWPKDKQADLAPPGKASPASKKKKEGAR